MPRQAIEITGLPALVRRFEVMGEELITNELLDEIALYVIASIQIRTQKGEDANGSPFTPYTPAYSAFRQRHGHPVNKVNLTFSGTMINSMTFDTSQSEVEIFFANTTDPNNDTPTPLKAFALNEDRRFFAVSTEEQNEIEDMVREHLAELVRGQRGR
jgi:hypothetical protein